MKKQMIRVVSSIMLLSVFATGISMEMNTPSLAAKKKAAVSIQLNKKKLSLSTSEGQYKLKAKVKPAKAKVSWKSSRPKVASVSSKGVVKPKKNGTTTITATARYKKKTKKATCKVTVTRKTVVTTTNTPQPTATAAASNASQPTAPAKQVQQIVTSQDSYTLEAGKTISLNASVQPADASNKALTYTSDNTESVTVDSQGQVHAVKDGVANITILAADGSQVKKVVKVMVVCPVTSIRQDTITLKIGETTTLAPKMAPEGATLQSCEVSNSKDYVASVAEDGSITAKYPGITVVKVSSLANPDVNCEFRIQVTDEFAPPEGFDQYDETIEHGTLADLNYESPYRPRGRAHALVWLPPNYDENKEYNLLFCLHGGTDDEYYWTSDKGGENDGCSGDKVLDYLYSQNLMEDTIVVFTSGVISYKEDQEYPGIVANPLLTDFWKNHFLLEFEIINTLMPLIRDTYPVMEGSDHTGICGLSMGCAQTMEIGLKHPDLFSYVGCYSAGPFEKDDQPFVTSKEDADALNAKLKLLFFITGENDHMMDDSMRNFVKTCDGFGVNHVFYEVPGRGHDDHCWDRCLYAFMKYAFK